jgi:uncharacterized protein
MQILKTINKKTISKPQEPSPMLHTFSGLIINILNPDQDSILIEDIAHSLSLQCRFGGRTKGFYSVSEHSVRVSLACAKKDALWGLLHDASEAYLVDIPRPIKCLPQMSGYMELEKIFMNAICEKFGLEKEMPPSVMVADNKLLITEKRDLLNNEQWKDSFSSIKPLKDKICPWTPKKAMNEFLKRYKEIML